MWAPEQPSAAMAPANLSILPIWTKTKCVYYPHLHYKPLVWRHKSNPLNQFETSMKTFQVRVECQYQASSGMEKSFNPIETNDKNDTYGNRYISGQSPFTPLQVLSSIYAYTKPPQDFIHGGHFYARVSIFAENKSSFTEISEALVNLQLSPLFPLPLFFSLSHSSEI